MWTRDTVVRFLAREGNMRAEIAERVIDRLAFEDALALAHALHRVSDELDQARREARAHARGGRP